VSRVQLALNVPNIDDAVAFYSKLFATEPHKRKPGYANFAVADPPLKLVLFEAPGAEARLNHLGVEVADSDAVWDHQQRLATEGVDAVDGSGTCCFAKQDKVWVDAPDGSWEIYTVLADSDAFGQSSTTVAEAAEAAEAGEALCCASVPESEARCCG
jgi:catechol 2,3-dioxygenase-like lactoylglutathione lyase family enzyme